MYNVDKHSNLSRDPGSSSAVYIATSQGHLLPAKVISLNSKAAYITGLNGSHCLDAYATSRSKKGKRSNIDKGLKSRPLKGHVLVTCIANDQPSTQSRRVPPTSDDLVCPTTRVNQPMIQRKPFRRISTSYPQSHPYPPAHPAPPQQMVTPLFRNENGGTGSTREHQRNWTLEPDVSLVQDGCRMKPEVVNSNRQYSANTSINSTSNSGSTRLNSPEYSSTSNLSCHEFAAFPCDSNEGEGAIWRSNELNRAIYTALRQGRRTSSNCSSLLSSTNSRSNQSCEASRCSSSLCHPTNQTGRTTGRKSISSDACSGSTCSCELWPTYSSSTNDLSGRQVASSSLNPSSESSCKSVIEELHHHHHSKHGSCTASQPLREYKNGVRNSTGDNDDDIDNVETVCEVNTTNKSVKNCLMGTGPTQVTCPQHRMLNSAWPTDHPSTTRQSPCTGGNRNTLTRGCQTLKPTTVKRKAPPPPQQQQHHYHQQQQGPSKMEHSAKSLSSHRPHERNGVSSANISHVNQHNVHRIQPPVTKASIPPNTNAARLTKGDDVRRGQEGDARELDDIPCTNLDDELLSHLPQTRTINLHKTTKGYGFVLRGRADKDQKVGDIFKASRKCPALQYISEVYKDSAADMAGLRARDFLLEINGDDVVLSTHEYVSQLIKSCGTELSLTVVAAQNDKIDIDSMYSKSSPLTIEEDTKTLSSNQRTKSPLHTVNTGFGVPSSILLDTFTMSNHHNNNNTKHKNSNNTTASIRTRSSKILTSVHMDEILESHILSEQIANYPSLHHQSNNQRLQPEVLDKMYTKSISIDEGIDIPPPSLQENSMNPGDKTITSSTIPQHDNQPISTFLTTTPETTTSTNNYIKGTVVANGVSSTEKLHPSTTTPTLIRQPHDFSNAPAVGIQPKTSTITHTPTSSLLLPPTHVLNKNQARIPHQSSPVRDTNIIADITTPSSDYTQLKSTLKPLLNSLSETISSLPSSSDNSLVAQLAAINLKPRSSLPAQPPSSSTIISPNHLVSLNSDLVQAIHRRRCMVDSPDDRENESKITSTLLKTDSQNNKSTTSTEGSPSMGFKALAEQLRQQWIIKQKTTANSTKSEEINNGDIERMVSERSKGITTTLTLDTHDHHPNSTVYPSPVTSSSTAAQIVTDNLNSSQKLSSSAPHKSSSSLPPPPPPPPQNLQPHPPLTEHPHQQLPPAHVQPTYDSVSLTSSGVASALSSLTDDSPPAPGTYDSPPVSRAHDITLPTRDELQSCLDSPVLQPPVRFADFRT